MGERLRVLRNPGFRNLWLGQAASAVGDSMVLVALALFVTDLTGSATDVGLVLGAQMLAQVAFLLVGGVWADRLPRARLMISTDVVRAVLHVLVAVLIFTDAIEIWQLVAIELLFGAAAAFFQPAYTGLVPQTVPADQIQDAQALSSLTANTAELVGPALATVLVLGLGAEWAFTLDAATFAVSALLLARVRTRTGEPAEPSERRPLLAELAEGFQEVRSRTWLWVTVAVFSLIVPLGYAPLLVLGPTVAEDAYGSAALFGIVTTLLGAGALVGALIGLRWRPRHPLRTAFLALTGWPVLLVAFGTTSPEVLLVAAAALTGMGFAIFDVLWDTAMAERVPPHALSRASSYEWMGSLVFLPVGYLLAGPAAEATSPETVMIGGGALTAILLAAGLIPRATRMLERIEHVERV